jgi:DNA (cytosine-5)-methyltransferase 1
MPEVDADGIASALRAAEGGSSRPYVAQLMAVRRLTPVECERLMGFKDNHTLIPWPSANRKGRDLAETVFYLTKIHGYSDEEAFVLAQTPDGPRYRALGNSKGVPLVRKIGVAMMAAWPEAA